MVCLKKNRIILVLILTNFLLLSLTPASMGSTNNSWWNNNWSYRQEMNIPIDTSTKYSKFQPIDIKIKFDNPCWAKNEKENSIRIIFQHKNMIKELESQVYDLNFINTNIINSCNVVFIIPEEADGTEKYYIYYDDTTKPPSNYKDHVNVEESYYYFAPITVYPFESKFFKITEDENVVYGVSYEGELLGVGTTQQVTKFKENTKEVSTPKDIESWASFDFFYNYGDDLRAFSSTLQKFVSKQLLIDGNLMTKFTITSISSKNDFKTTATYTYYYDPSPNKRICVHIKHEALKEAHVVANSPHTESCGNIAGVQIGSFRSPSIKELNFGKMYPYLHIYSEQNTIQEYKLDLDPEYNPEGIPVLKTEDDIDLGEHTWASFDEGEKGTAHGFIFESNQVLSSGTDERDRIQVKSYEYSPPRVIGLEIDLASYYFTRNSYEKGAENDLIIPKDYVVEYNAEFFSTPNGGYKTIDKESIIFQKLSKQRPVSQLEQKNEKQNNKEKYNLTAYIHLAPSSPFGTTFSLLTRKNFSYITGELYKEGKLISTGFAQRISLKEIPNYNNKTLLEKLKTTKNIFDLKNISFYKKIKFNNLEKGTYLIKIYKVHPLFGKERRYIGFKIINIEKNTKTHIFCKQQRSLNITVTDQKGEKVNNVKIKLNYKNITISEEITSEKGQATISAPYNQKEKYNLLLLYKGFLIHKEQVKLGFLKKLKPTKKSFEIERYNLNLNIKDTWHESPSYKLNPFLISNNMIEEHTITPDLTISNNKYIFNNLPSNEYTLQINYKSFNLKEEIKLNKNTEYNLIFPAEFKITIKTYDLRGNQLEYSLLKIKRNNKTLEIKCNKNEAAKTALPPGTYYLEVYNNNKKIAERSITVIGQRTFDVVTTAEPSFPVIITVCLLTIIAISSYLLLIRKRDKRIFLKILVIAIILLAVVQPWWCMHGFSSNQEIKISSYLYLIPPELTTLTKGSNINAGELGLDSLSDIIINIMITISILIVISVVLLILNIIFEKYNKKRLGKITFILAVLSLTTVIGIFSYTTAKMTEIGIGGFLGKGNIKLQILGEGESMAINSTWGPSTGFYLCMLAITILILLMFPHIINRSKNRGEEKYH